MEGLDDLDTTFEKKIPLLVIVGPTASGKTRLAVELAKRLDGEVVSADSMQVYKRMDIATAKPTQIEMDGIPHHLIGFLEPDNTVFSVADYTSLAQKTITEIHRRGKLPILCGGTGLYISAVVDHLDLSAFPGDPALRQRLQKEAAEKGGGEMLARLRQVDPALAEKLHPNNLGRVIRALEVWECTGVPMSEHQRRARETPAPYRLCMLGLRYNARAVLYERINRRVDAMLAQGLLDEAREISAAYGGTARQAIGYKELTPYLNGTASLEDCIEKLKQATRRYAKRQLTWFGRDDRIQWLYPDQYENLQELFTNAQMLVHKSGII